MAIGFIYILSNPAMPGYLKIGHTRDVKDRIRELGATGVPLAFEVEYSAPCDDVEIVETLVHAELNDCRAVANREFFVTDLQRAIGAVEKHLRAIPLEAYLSPRAQGEREAIAPAKSAAGMRKERHPKWRSLRCHTCGHEWTLPFERTPDGVCPKCGWHVAKRLARSK